VDDSGPVSIEVSRLLASSFDHNTTRYAPAFLLDPDDPDYEDPDLDRRFERELLDAMRGLRHAVEYLAAELDRRA
jgi:hypothetical protein